MIKAIFTISILFLTAHIHSQSIGRQVLGCTGTISSAESKFTSTVGPSILNTVEGEENILTQGFQQPSSGSIELSVLVINPDCYDIDAGQIDLSLSGCTGEFEILWSTGDTTAVVDDLLPGTYFVTITSGSCSLTDSILVSLNEDCGEKIPNLVTPNADGTNDFLEIPQFYLESNLINEVLIYNQWGQELWRGSNYDNSTVVWSGLNSDGDTLPAGTYYYFFTEGEIQYSGFIELMR